MLLAVAETLVVPDTLFVSVPSLPMLLAAETLGTWPAAMEVKKI